MGLNSNYYSEGDSQLQLNWDIKPGMSYKVIVANDWSLIDTVLEANAITNTSYSVGTPYIAYDWAPGMSSAGPRVTQGAYPVTMYFVVLSKDGSSNVFISEIMAIPFTGGVNEV